MLKFEKSVLDISKFEKSVLDISFVFDNYHVIDEFNNTEFIAVVGTEGKCKLGIKKSISVTWFAHEKLWFGGILVFVYDHILYPREKQNSVSFLPSNKSKQ